jgi:hypothetical protein
MDGRISEAPPLRFKTRGVIARLGNDSMGVAGKLPWHYLVGIIGITITPAVACHRADTANARRRPIAFEAQERRAVLGGEIPK